MKNLDLISLFKKYRSDAVIATIEQEYLDLEKSLLKLTELAKTDPSYLKIKEEALALRRKFSSLTLSRINDLSIKRKTTKIAVVAAIVSLFAAGFSFYKTKEISLNNTRNKEEIYSLLSEELEQSSQDHFDKIKDALIQKMDSKLTVLQDDVNSHIEKKQANN